jgi:hypothetical protein
MQLPTRAPDRDGERALGDDPLLLHDVPHADVLGPEREVDADRRAGGDEHALEPAEHARRLARAVGEGQVQLRDLVAVDAARVRERERDLVRVLVERGRPARVGLRGGGDGGRG